MKKGKIEHRKPYLTKSVPVPNKVANSGPLDGSTHGPKRIIQQKQGK